MQHIETELNRLRARLVAYPNPNEHAGLYAAQQALMWAREPDNFASPFDTVVGTEPKQDEGAPAAPIQGHSNA